WRLQLRLRDGSWSIEEAKTEEQSIAAQLLATSGDAAREVIVEAHDDCDRVAVGLALGEATLDVYRYAGGPTRDEQMDRAGDAVALFHGGAAIEDQWLALAEASGSCDDLARVLLVRGNARCWVEPSDEGALLLQAAALADQVDDPRLPLKALHNYAVFHQRRGG